MAERVNPPPQVGFPQNNPFPLNTAAGKFVQQLITANNQQRIIIEQLWRRTGKGDDLVSTTEIREVSLFGNRLAEGAAGINTAALFGGANRAEPEPLQVREITGGAYVALVGQWIKASNRSSIFFPQYAGVNDRLRITNIDGSVISLDGNGKAVNGFATGKMRRKDRSIDFEYDGIGWRAV